jgi:hypothetical protein
MISGWVPFVFAGGNFLIPKAKRSMIPGGRRGNASSYPGTGKREGAGICFRIG